MFEQSPAEFSLDPELGDLRRWSAVGEAYGHRRRATGIPSPSVVGLKGRDLVALALHHWEGAHRMRRYDETIEVFGPDLENLPVTVAEAIQVQRDPAQELGAPGQFLWRGRLYVVREVLGSWVETLPWWRRRRSVPGGSPGWETEREVWRVVAAAGRRFPDVVVDLALDCSDGHWVLQRVHD